MRGARFSSRLQLSLISMTVHFPFLLLAITLLWFPRQWLRHSAAFFRRRRKSESSRIVEPWREREAGDPRIGFAREFGKLRNYVDLLRGAAGSLALFGGMGVTPAVSADAGATPTIGYQVMAIRAAVLVIGLLIQTVRIEKGRLTFYPPIFYLAGMSVGLCDYRGAIFAFALIWAINPALPNAQAFLTVYALLLVTFGHFFSRRSDMLVMYLSGLTFLPVLLSLLARRPLVILSRKAMRTHMPS